MTKISHEKRRRTAFLLLAVLALASLALACTFSDATTPAPESESDIETQIAIEVSNRLTAEAGGDPSSQGGDQPSDGGDAPVPEDTSLPTFTVTPSATPTITMTPTPEKPMLSVNVDTNCRVGPGGVYDYLGAILVGETAEIFARNANSTYWYIRNPDDSSGFCWAWGEYATVTGNTAGLPVFTPPPTPTPTFTPMPDWNGTWTVWIETGPSGVAMTITQTGSAIHAEIPLGGSTTYCDGVLSADGRTATGTYNSDGGPVIGNFTWHMLDNYNQFNGNWNQGGPTGAWCGARGGMGQPSPCMYP